LVVQTVIISLVLAIVVILNAYFAWTNFLDFHNHVVNNLAWYWGSFYFMVSTIFLAGLFSGILFLFVAVIGYMQRESQKTLEREKLKEEIKKELEAERQKGTH
jgi:uncharacterized membrane protein